MLNNSLKFEYTPRLNNALFITGFDGWGNALDISVGMADYLIRQLKATPFGWINPDHFYRFDEKRPVVTIDNGLIQDVKPPGGTFYLVNSEQAGRDIIILKANEPNLQWFRFIDSTLSLCQETGVKTIINIGSMYDNVLHTDKIISALASSTTILEGLKDKNVASITYKGPGAIHSSISVEAVKRGIECLSLWCHCPYYLHGTTHFGLLSHLGNLLTELGGFKLDTEDLSITWKEISRQIQDLIDKNPELQKMIGDLKKEKFSGSWSSPKKHNNIIKIEDFLKHK